MSNIPADLKYTSDDEWIKIEGNIATIGITDFAQDQLSDIVYLELPAVGDVISAGDSSSATMFNTQLSEDRSKAWAMSRSKCCFPQLS